MERNHAEPQQFAEQVCAAIFPHVRSTLLWFHRGAFRIIGKKMKREIMIGSRVHGLVLRMSIQRYDRAEAEVPREAVDI
jgi:hypothetical protein